MSKMIDFLKRNTWVNILLILSYFVAVVLPHKLFGAFLIDVVFKDIPMPLYNRYILIGGTVILLLFSFIYFKNALKSNYRNRLIFYFIANVALVAVIMNVLFVLNTEVAHFPQYAIMAILLFPLIGHYHQTLILSVLMGIIDESYQYFYLAPLDTSYYDFNDVVTNLAGAVFGLLFIWSLGVQEFKTYRFWKSPGTIGGLLLAIVLFILHWQNILSIYPNANIKYHLLRTWPTGFWSHINPNITFHIMRPIEGTVITLLLIRFYYYLGDRQT